VLLTHSQGLIAAAFIYDSSLLAVTPLSASRNINSLQTERFNSPVLFICSVENNSDTFHLRAIFKVLFVALVQNKDGNGKIKLVGRAKVVIMRQLGLENC
jgi:hypothetical protein